MAFGLMMVYQRIVLEWVVDFDGRHLEECAFALRVLAIRHNRASRFSANS
jgi:hypothetical protein